VAESIWIIDPDDRSGSALESLLTEISLDVERRSHVTGQAPDVLILSGCIDETKLADYLQEFRSLPLGDVAAVVILGGSGDASHALALGADLFVSAPTNLEAFLEAIEPFVQVPIPIDASERRILSSRGDIKIESSQVDPLTVTDQKLEKEDEGQSESSEGAKYDADIPEISADLTALKTTSSSDEDTITSHSPIHPSDSISPPALGDEGDLSSGMLQVIADSHEANRVEAPIQDSTRPAAVEPTQKEVQSHHSTESDHVENLSTSHENNEIEDAPTAEASPDDRHAVDQRNSLPEKTSLENEQASETDEDPHAPPLETQLAVADEQVITTQDPIIETDDTEQEHQIHEKAGSNLGSNAPPETDDIEVWEAEINPSESPLKEQNDVQESATEDWISSDVSSPSEWNDEHLSNSETNSDQSWGHDQVSNSDEKSDQSIESQWSQSIEVSDADFKDPLEMDPSTVDTQDSWTDETEETDEWNSEDSEAGSWDLKDSNQEKTAPNPGKLSPSSWQAEELPSEDGTWEDEQRQVSSQQGWNTPSESNWNQTPTLGRDRLRYLGQQLGQGHLQYQAPMGSIGALSTTGFLGLIGRLAHDRITGRIDVANQDQSLSLFCQNGKLVSISSPFLDRWFLRSTEAKGLLDPDETRALQHLAERQHLPLTSLLMKEGVLNSNQWLDLAQECAETFLLDFASLPGGHANYLPEAPNDWAYPLQVLSARARVLAMVPSLIKSSLWPAVVGGDDVRPSPPRRPLEMDFPGRQGLMNSDGHQSLLQLAARFSLPIEELRQGLLAALALGDMEIIEIGVSHLHQQQRKHRSFERSVDQIRSGDYFHVLGLADALDEQEIERAYRSRLALLRTQLNSHDPLFEELLYELQEARDVLLDPHLRDHYRSSRPL